MSGKKTKLSQWNIFLIFLKLGLTSFGGPIAHIGYFRDEFVTRRKWLGDAQFTELSSLCHFLPGPSSSQLGMMLGLYKGGVGGTFAAWLGFTLPSALIMLMLGLGFINFGQALPGGLIHGLKLLAVAVVLQALIGMARSLTPDMPRILIAILSCGILLFISDPIFQTIVIIFGGMCGFLFLQGRDVSSTESIKIAVSRRVAFFALTAFFGCLVFLPILTSLTASHSVQILDGFYRAGSLVFGGGHVVLPLLNGETVAKGLINEDAFLAGYASAQALPGPLFTFAAYLGAMMGTGLAVIFTSGLALIAIFLPAFLLVFGVLPFWDDLRQKEPAGKILNGVNAAVVGLLAAILYDPLWTGSVKGWQDFVFGTGFFVMLYFLRIPVWLCVIASSILGMALL